MNAKASNIRVLLVLMLGLLATACAAVPQTEPTSPEYAVEQTFLSYKEALLARDGAGGAALVTADSWEYYREMADEALVADRDRLEQMNFADRVIVMLFRHALTPAELRRMSGEELVAVSIDKGWISRESTANLRLTNYSISGDSAQAYAIRRDGKLSTVKLDFAQERGAWRLDLLGIIAISRTAMPLAIALSGMTENDLLFATLKEGTGRTAGPEIWTPPS